MAAHPLRFKIRSVWDVALLLLGGVLLFAWGRTETISIEQWAIVIAAVILAVCISRMQWPASMQDAKWIRMAKVLGNPSPRRRAAIALAIWPLAAIFIALSCKLHGFGFEPRVNDEFSYLLQMRMLQHGALWMPALPLPEFFDTYEVLVRPVYASRYSPGTALFFLPTFLLHLPTWLIPLICGGAAAAMFYRVVAELIDAAAALIGVAILLTFLYFQWFSLRVMSQLPMILLTLLALWAWLRWRKTDPVKRWRWALLTGAIIGFASITRPSDAALLALPLAAAFLADMRVLSWRRGAASIGLGIAAVIPFIALQFYCNMGITGHWREFPWTLYAQQDQPAEEGIIGTGNMNQKPLTDVPEKQIYYRWMTGKIRERQTETVWEWFFAPPSRAEDAAFPMLLFTIPSSPLLGMLIPLGFFAAFTRRNAGIYVLLAFSLLVTVFYVLRPMGFQTHYAAMLAPELVIFMLIALRELPRISQRYARSISAAAVVFLLAASAMAWVVHSTADRSPGEAREHILNEVNRNLSRIPERRALVLFRRAPDLTEVAEPVYNLEAAWPWDSRIVRAHDRGDENWRIIDYCADLDAHCAVYRYDMNMLSDRLTYLGTAGNLAKSWRQPDRAIQLQRLMDLFFRFVVPVEGRR